MNELAPRLAAAALAASLLLSACSDGGDAGDAAAEAPPLAGAAIGGPFELVDETGETVRDTDFEGDYRLVYFGYTFCPDVCPVDMQKLGQGMRALEASDPELGARIQPIFVSVDPARDTPEVLAEYTDNFHPRLLGMTGSREAIDAMTQRYGVYYRLHDEEGGENYLVDHSNNVTLFGPGGEPLALIPMQGTGEEIAAEIRRWAS